MAPYIYIIAELIAVLLIANSEENRKKYIKTGRKVFFKRSRYLLVLSFLPFAILFCLRHVSVGSDFYNYARMYLKIGNNSLSTREIEWLGLGFRTYCTIANFFFNQNYLLVFAIFNNLTLYFFYKTIVDNSKIWWLSLLLFFCFCLHFQIFNQFRQMFAVGLTFLNFNNLKNKNLKKYVIINLIAGAIHKTSLIMIPFYFIANMKINKKNLILYLIVGIVFYFGFGIVENVLSSTYYGSVYFGSKYDVETSSTILNFLVRIVLLIFSLLFCKNLLKKEEKNKYLYNMVIFCTLFQVLAMKSYIFARLTTYFFVYYIILIPEILVSFKDLYTKKIVTVMLIIVLCLYQYVYYNSSSGASGGGYDKYYFYWQDVISSRSV